jgi:hypothetical protein
MVFKGAKQINQPHEQSKDFYQISNIFILLYFFRLIADKCSALIIPRAEE